VRDEGEELGRERGKERKGKGRKSGKGRRGEEGQDAWERKCALQQDTTDLATRPLHFNNKC